MSLKKTRNTAISMEKILQAAEEVFIRKGFSGSTLDEIAKKARVTKGLIVHHFKNKTKLWAAVKNRAYEGYTREQHSNLDRDIPAMKMLDHVINVKFDFFRNNPNFIRINSWMLAEQDRQHEDLRLALAKRAHEFFLKGQQKGEFRKDVNHQSMYYMYLCLIDHWFIERFRHIENFENASPDEVARLDNDFQEDMKKIFMSGLAKINEK